VIERLRPVRDRLGLVGGRITAFVKRSSTDHRVPTIAVSVVAVVAIARAEC
jgi:hypothetical protein